MISSRPTHISPIIVIFAGSPIGANDPIGPVTRTRADVPERGRGGRQRIERSEPRAGDCRVEREHGAAHGPEAHVQEDERGDRPERALVHRGPVQADGQDDLGAHGLVELPPEHLGQEEVPHDLDRSSRRPRGAADEHQREQGQQERGRPEREVGARHPVVVMIETAWKNPARTAASPSAIPYAQSIAVSDAEARSASARYRRSSSSRTSARGRRVRSLRET